MPIGQKRNPKIKTNSIDKSNNNKTISVIITIDFINIPMPMENPTSPCRYSFFHGRKYVLIKSGRENNSKKALLSEPKKAKRSAGASQNQNFKKIKGSFK